eukprot:CAMPEP_0206407634 /NCGR_PEP_ID=MMETSP0294-20121207/30626_1 /ASSEMBLY_ACC=CAM_ASM_000327 /TAXON_ID=39354 /ORGANISM="Heterosigma akashiwo, Strain CCMP2393" /LENGTH=159 /DNA_ID=CAMNT_0053866851 /DNA_START=14 /DNA_END=490 /DNA_ORIENTATION=+
MAVNLPPEHWGIRTIAAYERIEQIGEGAYGRVFRARNKYTNEIVAMKKIRIKDESQGLPLTAIREIKILKKLSHPAMVKLKEIVTSKSREDLDEDDDPNGEPWATGPVSRAAGNLFLVLEYCAHDLSGLLDARYPFGPRALKSLAQQLLAALRYVHDQR